MHNNNIKALSWVCTNRGKVRGKGVGILMDINNTK
jgi:hypothetical protein